MMESLSLIALAFLSRPRLCKSSEFFGYPWSAVTNLSHVERGFPRKFLGIPLRRGETIRKVDDFQPSVRFFQPRELWVKLPVTKRLLDAGDFAQCPIHWQSKWWKAYHVGLFFLALACASLQNSFGYPWSAVTNLSHVERGFPRKFLGIPLWRGETIRKVDDFQPSVHFFQPRELWVKLPVTKRLLDAEDFAQCPIHWQSKWWKAYHFGLFFVAKLVQVFRILWISLECCDQSQPCGKRSSSKVFGHSFAAGGNQKEGRRFSAFSAFLSAERALSEVACHKAAFGRWRFRTVSDPLAE